jgi:hypothetical protein
MGVEGINDSSRAPKPAPKPAQDFDEGSDDLWSLYGKEAKSHDEEWIKVLKEDMDAILIFVRAYLFCSASADDQSHSRLVYSLLFSPRSSSQRFRI